jgi:hypothetical protein
MAGDPAWLAIASGVVSVRVRVQPRARAAGIAGVAGDRLRLRLTAPPLDGRANAEAAALVARLAGVPRSAVAVSHGATHRNKTLRVSTRDPAGVAARLVAAAAPCAGRERVLE